MTVMSLFANTWHHFRYARESFARTWAVERNTLICKKRQRRLRLLDKTKNASVHMCNAYANDEIQVSFVRHTCTHVQNFGGKLWNKTHTHTRRIEASLTLCSKCIRCIRRTRIGRVLAAVSIWCCYIYIYIYPVSRAIRWLQTETTRTNTQTNAEDYADNDDACERVKFPPDVKQQQRISRCL